MTADLTICFSPPTINTFKIRWNGNLVNEMFYVGRRSFATSLHDEMAWAIGQYSSKEMPGAELYFIIKNVIFIRSN